jgi:GDPmannose 4,6-dehydratase
MTKTAIITGVTGQDGSFLADQLLERGYKVYGLRRRSSSNSLGNAAHLASKVEFVNGDLNDLSSLIRLCSLARADEFYHLAAQSHVGISFEQPLYTVEANAIGTFNCLEAVRLSGIHTRFYHAATSELFGGLTSSACNEDTPFHPRSPYGVAKLAGFWATVNYRESYKMFACNGILFNHECFFYDTPVIIKRSSGDLDIVYVASLVPHRKNIAGDESALTKDYQDSGIQIWDGSSFVDLLAVSRKKLSNLQDPADRCRQVTISPCASVSTTPNHKLIKTKNQEVEARHVSVGTDIVEGVFPVNSQDKAITTEFAEFLGLLAGDGYVDRHVRLTNNDPSIQQNFVQLAKKIYTDVCVNVSSFISGFGGTTTHIDLSGIHSGECLYLRSLLYDRDTKHKRVPALILNAPIGVKTAFLRGYYQADGLKKDKCKYEFRSFKTNSALLAQGLLYLINETIGAGICVNTFIQNNKIYHQVNLRSPLKTGKKGDHLLLKSCTVKKTFLREEEDQHVFDIETSSGVVMAGIGRAIVGNSPRRGENFVSRKISKAVAAISCGKQEKLYLGNLDAKRDWGDAEDYVEAMRLMLSHKEPGDYVVATGETHSIREFCELAFVHAGLGDYSKYVEIDPAFYRPAEVNILLGDPSKAKAILGWEPKTKFADLVRKMVEHDLGLI